MKLYRTDLEKIENLNGLILLKKQSLYLYIFPQKSTDSFSSKLFQNLKNK